MARVGEQGERPRGKTGDDFDDEKPGDESESECERPTVGVGPRQMVGVRVLDLFLPSKGDLRPSVVADMTCMIRSTSRGRQRYVWARFFVRQYALASNGQPRSAPAGSATKGYETGTKWR